MKNNFDFNDSVVAIIMTMVTTAVGAAASYAVKKAGEAFESRKGGK